MTAIRYHYLAMSPGNFEPVLAAKRSIRNGVIMYIAAYTDDRAAYKIMRDVLNEACRAGIVFG